MDTEKQKKKQERDEQFQKAREIAKAYLERLMKESKDASFKEIAEDVRKNTGQDIQPEK